LQIEKRQTIACRERLCGNILLTDGQVEDLPDLVISVPSLLAHVETPQSLG
jgi:hypothetical protein